jgi:hypothetical protein
MKITVSIDFQGTIHETETEIDDSEVIKVFRDTADFEQEGEDNSDYLFETIDDNWISLDMFPVQDVYDEWKIANSERDGGDSKE